MCEAMSHAIAPAGDVEIFRTTELSFDGAGM